MVYFTHHLVGNDAGSVLATIQSNAEIIFDQENQYFLCKGNWSVLGVHDLTVKIQQMTLPSQQTLTIQGRELTQFDSAGALVLKQLLEVLEKKNNTVTLQDFKKPHHDLLHLLAQKEEILAYTIPPATKKNILYRIGHESAHKVEQALGLITLIGDLCVKLVGAVGHWRRFQFPSIVSNIYSTGVQALPIIGLLSFLIGVVLAYQMGLQLETYGANIFIAYLSGMALFREFAPLITAVIVAGRTGSAFTAQIGSMKINEEIDALNTMGLSPTELLVVPKVLGLLLVFPLLIFWADVFSVLGAMMMSKSMLGVSYAEFINRLQESVGVKQLMLGLYKAPAFALLIALVGCFQGFKVQANADSVGMQTTKSVVQALFLIIVADAAFSIAYSWQGL